MKTLILFFCLIALVSGCGAYRRHSSTEEEHSRSFLERDRVAFRLFSFQQDSSSRHWYFYSDSLFLYHPDSGLQAKSGWLWGQDILLQKTLHQHRLDSITLRTEAEEQRRVQQQDTRVGHHLVWYLVGLVLLVFGIFVLWQKKWVKRLL